MTKRCADLGASVTARLLNRARETGDDYQTTLSVFCKGYVRAAAHSNSRGNAHRTHA